MSFSFVYMRVINKIHTHIYSRLSPLLRVTTGCCHHWRFSCSFRSPMQIKCHVATYAKNSFDRANIDRSRTVLRGLINTKIFENHTGYARVMNCQRDAGSVVSKVGRPGEPRREFLQGHRTISTRRRLRLARASRSRRAALNTQVPGCPRSSRLS